MKFDVADQVENIGERLPFLCLIHSLLFCKMAKRTKQTNKREGRSLPLNCNIVFIYTIGPPSRVLCITAYAAARFIERTHNQNNK